MNVLGTVGDLIKSGAFRQVYLGMDLDSSEILAIKQVSLPSRFW
jgi:mitogen-activated protein kinase kinase kinase ANP1